jgi:hypothetical protein
MTSTESLVETISTVSHALDLTWEYGLVKSTLVVIAFPSIEM